MLSAAVQPGTHSACGQMQHLGYLFGGVAFVIAEKKYRAVLGTYSMQEELVFDVLQPGALKKLWLHVLRILTLQDRPAVKVDEQVFNVR